MDIKVVAITRVLNEADVIEALVRHTAAYVSHHVFLDNGSADGTLEILSSLKKEGVQLTVFQSRAVTFNDGEGLTFLYQIANREHAPDWVVSIDADEFIDDRKISGGLLAYLRNLTVNNDPIECISIPMVNYIATSSDNHSEPNVAVRLVRRQPEPSDAYKIILKGGLPEDDIVVGNAHYAYLKSRTLNEMKNHNIWLSHYPERSSFQYIAKFVRGWSKVVATGQHEINKNTSYHYRRPFEILRDEPQSLLKNPSFMQFNNESRENVVDPIIYRGTPLRYTNTPDEPMRAVRCLMGFFEELATSHGKMMEEVPGAREAVRTWEEHVDRILESKPEAVRLGSAPEGCVDLTEGALTNQSSVTECSICQTTESDSANAISKDVVFPYAFHTAFEDQPWWLIDFGKKVFVKELRIHNRLDNLEFAARGNDFVIERSQEPFSQWEEVGRRVGQGGFGGIDGTPCVFRFEVPVELQLLRIRLLGHGALHYQKIEVFGNKT